jgi:hypothetical protein
MPHLSEMTRFRALGSLNRGPGRASRRVDQIHETAGMGKGQVSNYGKGPKPGLSTGELRLSSLSSTWMESEHEGERRSSRLSCGGAG